MPIRTLSEICMIRRIAGIRHYSTKEPAKRSWGAITQAFSVSKPADDRVEISPNLLPKFGPNQLTYEASDFSLAKRRYDGTAKDIAQLEGLTKVDKFAQLNVNPLELWKSPTALSNYITSNGRIMPGYVTGNKGTTQKKLSKAIRRCRAAGLLSSVHKSVFDSA